MKKFLTTLALATCLLSQVVQAQLPTDTLLSLEVKLVDAEKRNVENAVFIFEPLFEVSSTDVPQQPPAVMNQINKQFVPHVLVVRTGTKISFPNADNLFHHVYSFSPTKQFELKLYKEFTAQPLTFDEPGIVDIGCNIHDWMLGYIVVANSPFFAKTNSEGDIAIELPRGDYKVTFWHPLVENSRLFSKKILSVHENMSLTWQLDSALPGDDGFQSGFGDY